jgi:hypothetical protein
MYESNNFFITESLRIPIPPYLMSTLSMYIIYDKTEVFYFFYFPKSFFILLNCLFFSEQGIVMAQDKTEF